MLIFSVFFISSFSFDNYFFICESKTQSMEWEHTASRVKKKLKTQV